MRATFRFFGFALVGVLLMVSVTSCGSSNASGSNGSSSTHHCGLFTKAKIALHVGVAYVAFKKFVYNPWRQGRFRTGAPHRKLKIVEAAAAALVGLHEAKVAVRELRACGVGNGASSALASIRNSLLGLKTGSGGLSDAQLGSQIQGLTNSYSRLRSAGK